MANFSFDKPFMKMFGKMNEALDSMIDEIKKFNVSDYEYGVCNTSYKIRFISPQNISEYIDMIARAFSKHMLETPADVEKFSVEAAKRMIKENNCDAFIASEPMSYVETPMHFTNLQDMLFCIKNDTFNKSCYSQFDLNQRHASVLRDLDKITALKFYPSMKNLVNGIPAVLNSADVMTKISTADTEIIREAIEEFILFAFTVNIFTVNEMKDYLIPAQTYNTHVENNNGTVVTECAILKTTDTDLRLNLPFSINIRNIALADMTDSFSDTRNAVKYITTDPKSQVAEMLFRYTKDMSEESKQEIHNVCGIINRMFKYAYAKDVIMPFEDKAVMKQAMQTPNMNVQWLDQLANGNQFIDASYRKDKQVTGNVTQSPFTENLNMLFKLFNGCGCDLVTNEELSINIIRVAKAIECVCDKYYSVENKQLLRDTLALLGEIMTRDIIMLVHNHTIVLDYTHENTMVPAYMYTESFLDEFDDDDMSYFMEADTEDKDQPKVTYQTSQGEVKKVTDRFQRFINWCRKLLSSIFKKFNKDHANEIKWVNSHEDEIKKISEALQNKTFIINLSNFPNFNIKVDELKPDIDKAVTEALNMNNKFNAKDFEAKLYPGKQGAAIANMAKPEDKNTAIANTILYGQVTEPPKISEQLNPQIWKEITDDLKESFNAIGNIVNHLSQSVNNGNQKVMEAIKKNENIPENASKQASEQMSAAYNRAKTISEILTNASNQYATTTVNALTKKFYGITYNTFADIVKAYRSQTKNNEAAANTTNNTEEAAKTDVVPENADTTAAETK